MYEYNIITSLPFHSRASGKLLLTGEYAVLNGARALALPTRFGQSLSVRQDLGQGKNVGLLLHWESLDKANNVWFSASFTLPGIAVKTASDRAAALMLQQVLRSASAQNPHFLQCLGDIYVETALDFERAWGLGTSSTLVANIARWAEVSPYPLLEASFGGSGYDLACAFAQGALLFQRVNGQASHIDLDYCPDFREQLYFVYLGKKQNSQAGIAHYRDKKTDNALFIREIDELTTAWLAARDIAGLEAVIRAHEACVSHTLGLSRAKKLYFEDYPGEIKSMGAWGGDFVLATTELDRKDVLDYFSKKGFDTVLSWSEMFSCC
jgi:mevalonate kinase